MISDAVQFGKLLYEKGYVVASEGNISFVEGGRTYITKSGVFKGFITENDFIEINRKGEPVSGNEKVSTEVYTHLAIYDVRPDVKAIIHAHPVYSITCSIAGIPLSEAIFPESLFAIGKVPITDYATPSTKEGAKVVKEWAEKTDVLILDRHGVFAFGKDIKDAFSKLEIAEKTAQITYLSHLYSPTPRKLTPSQIEKLKESRRNLELKNRILI